jgi:hypothetical protein
VVVEPDEEDVCEGTVDVMMIPLPPEEVEIMMIFVVVGGEVVEAEVEVDVDVDVGLENEPSGLSEMRISWGFKYPKRTR